MSQEKYIGLDVHQATISAAVMDAQGKLTPQIGHVMPLERAVEAYKLLEEGKNYGKIVVKIAE